MTAKTQRSRAASPGTRDLEARANALFARGAYAAAAALLRRALALPRPGPGLRYRLAQSLFLLGDTPAAVRELRRVARSRDPDSRRAALRKIATYAPGVPAFGNAQVLAARRRWACLEERLESPRLPTRAPSRRPRRKLRIGYVSAYLGFRNWMKPVWGVLDAHDRNAFEIHLFLDRGLPDRRFGFAPRPPDRVHSLDGLSNEAAARLVAAAGIDVLVDLNAYSDPARLGLFLRRPAPVQVGWFNTYATSGTYAFGYAVADRVALPAREERFGTERILRVPGSYLAFAVSYRVPRVVAPPCVRSRRVTFGCLAPQYKINDGVIAILAGILRAVPGARLLVKNTCMADAGNRAAIRARFVRRGISGRQLLLEGPAEHLAFLRAYDRVDVAIDTFPYSGGATTMEALWQGVPVLALSGDRWASRTSSSLLHAAGLGEWVCPSRRALLRRAVALARSPDTGARLSVLRAALRARLRASPACDVRGLCRALEVHYRAIARRRGRDRPKTQAVAPILVRKGKGR